MLTVIFQFFSLLSLFVSLCFHSILFCSTDSRTTGLLQDSFMCPLCHVSIDSSSFDLISEGVFPQRKYRQPNQSSRFPISFDKVI